MMSKKNPSEQEENKSQKGKNPTEKNPTVSEPRQLSQTSALKNPSTPYGAKGPKTRITIKYDVGFHNSLYLRGKGANLSWDKGIPLKNVKSDEWVWETDLPFTHAEFKVLINDKHYENGENHPLTCGSNVQYVPKFGN